MAEMMPQSALVPASDYVIIGGTGDLALRKIFPALFWRFLDGQVTSAFRLVAAARQPISLAEFAEKLRPFCRDALDHPDTDAAAFDAFIQLVHIVQLDILTGDGAADLSAFLQQKTSTDRPCIFYLAVAPQLFGPSCRVLQSAGLVLPQSRLVVEKPLGHDYASAQAIGDELRAVFDEKQIYRIDHYLGKETVQNLMALRFANVIFESQWNNTAIEHVQITVAETVGVGQRASYYNTSGAVRDMVQNHILQLVCLVAMEPPSFFDADQVRDEKLRVLRALRAPAADEVVRGQYQDYETELGEASNTETYVAMKLWVDNWRWAGVPFYVRTGKKLAMRASEIVITFKRKPHDIFSKTPLSGTEDDLPNRLIIRLQPAEGVRLQLISKEPGPGGMRLFPSELNLSFDDTFGGRLPDAYERLLMDTARGNQTLFMRHDEVLAAWSFIDPILARAAEQPPALYKAGTFGPVDDLSGYGPGFWIDPKADAKAGPDAESRADNDH